MSTEFKEFLKRRKLKSVKLPLFPQKSMKDSLAELRGQEHFYQKRGQALAAFLNELASMPHIQNSNHMLWFFHHRACDEVSQDRICQVRQMVRVQLQAQRFELLVDRFGLRSLYSNGFTPRLAADEEHGGLGGSNDERIMQLIIFYAFKSCVQARFTMTQLSKRAAIYFVQLEPPLLERYFNALQGK